MCIRDSYRTVDLPDVAQPPPGPSSPVSPAPGPAVVELSIDDVPAGAVAEQDIVTDEGTVLVAEGTVLTASHLARLRDLAAIIEISRLRIQPPA